MSKKNKSVDNSKHARSTNEFEPIAELFKTPYIRRVIRDIIKEESESEITHSNTEHATCNKSDKKQCGVDSCKSRNRGKSCEYLIEPTQGHFECVYSRRVARLQSRSLDHIVIVSCPLLDADDERRNAFKNASW